MQKQNLIKYIEKHLDDTPYTIDMSQKDLSDFDLSCVDNYMPTPLHCAYFQGTTKITPGQISYVLQHCDLSTQYNDLPIAMFAVTCKKDYSLAFNAEHIEYLIRHANLSFKDKKGFNLLMSIIDSVESQELDILPSTWAYLVDNSSLDNLYGYHRMEKNCIDLLLNLKNIHIIPQQCIEKIVLTNIKKDNYQLFSSFKQLTKIMDCMRDKTIFINDHRTQQKYPEEIQKYVLEQNIQLTTSTSPFKI